MGVRKWKGYQEPSPPPGITCKFSEAESNNPATDQKGPLHLNTVPPKSHTPASTSRVMHVNSVIQGSMHFHHCRHQHGPHLVTVIMTNVVVMDGLALKRSANTTYKRKGGKVKMQ